MPPEKSIRRRLTGFGAQRFADAKGDLNQESRLDRRRTLDGHNLHNGLLRVVALTIRKLLGPSLYEAEVLCVLRFNGSKW